MPDKVVANLHLGVASLVAGGETLDGAEFAASLSAAGLKVDALKLSIPGHTKLAFTGTLLPHPAGASLAGDVRLELASLRELVTWLLPEQAEAIDKVWSGQRGQLDLSGTNRCQRRAHPLQRRRGHPRRAEADGNLD